MRCCVIRNGNALIPDSGLESRDLARPGRRRPNPGSARMLNGPTGRDTGLTGGGPPGLRAPRESGRDCRPDQCRMRNAPVVDSGRTSFSEP